MSRLGSRTSPASEGRGRAACIPMRPVPCPGHWRTDWLQAANIGLPLCCYASPAGGRRTRDYRSLGPRADDGSPVAEWSLSYRASFGFGLPLYLSEAVNVCHAVAVKLRVPPSRSVVSRTITPASDATSTHCPPVDPL
jgi:hypothetical protein